MRKFALAWLLMWALSYVAVAILAPDISGDVVYGRLLYLVMAIAILCSWNLLELSRIRINKQMELIAKVCLFALAVIEVFSAIASWSGVAIWNVPFPNKELFQVSMAFADLISAAFMIYLVLE